MPKFRVLDAADSAQYNHWTTIWESWESREVFAHPEFSKSVKRTCDSALCAVHEDAGGVVFLPVILRPLAAEIWAGRSAEHRDIVTPYGFGGPYVMGAPNMEEFWSNLTKWAEQNRIITAFFRLSPFAADIRRFVDQVEIKGGNVIRSLTEGKENIWNEFDKAVRRHIRRAESMGMTLEVDSCGERMDEFIRIYYQTMRRRNALPSYYFSEQLYYNIFQEIPGSSILFHVVTRENMVIRSEMVLIGKENMYAFLGGADERFANPHAGEFLTRGIIDWGIENGKKRYILGGGYDGCDGIFKFKKKFAPHGIIPFEVGKHIFDQTAYKNMVEKRRNYECSQSRNWVDDSSYFPAYRTKSD